MAGCFLHGAPRVVAIARAERGVCRWRSSIFGGGVSVFWRLVVWGRGDGRPWSMLHGVRRWPLLSSFRRQRCPTQQVVSGEGWSEQEALAVGHSDIGQAVPNRLRLDSFGDDAQS